MKIVVVLASIIIALIFLSLFIVASYGQYVFHPGHHQHYPFYFQPASLPSSLFPTYASYPSLPQTHGSYIPTPSQYSHIPTYTPTYQPVMAIPAPSIVPVTPVVIPSYNQPAPPQPDIDRSSKSDPPTPPPLQPPSPAPSSPSTSKGGLNIPNLFKSFSIPNDFADKLFPFSIRIATHGEPHMP